MIIKFPTALFKTVLPGEYGSGNVIFTISNNTPPRATSTTLQLPVASIVRLRETDVTDLERRVALGELLFTITSGFRQDLGTGKKAFEVGQFLDFTDESVATVDPIKVPEDIVIQHNTNLLDLPSSGLNTEQINILINKSVEKFNSLKKQLSVLQSEAADLKVRISENQKAINEQNKIINVAKIITSSDDEIYIELNEKLEELLNERTQLIASLTNKNLEAETVYNQLVTISVVVK